MAGYPIPANRGDFRIAVLCALTIEADAVVGMFDEQYSDYGKADGDPNSYRFGRLRKHDVVVATMGDMGPLVASSVAQGLRSSFDRIRLALVVGICGGVPSIANEMILGDVVISTAIVQLGFGRQHPDKLSEKRTLEDQTGRSSQEVQSFLAQMSGLASLELKDAIKENLTSLFKRQYFQSWVYPGAENDILYPPSHRHKHQDANACATCANCTLDKDEVCEDALRMDCKSLKCDGHSQIERTRLRPFKTLALTSKPSLAIHFGRVGSGTFVMKSASHRDHIATAESLIAYEMEGSGVWGKVSTIVVKGVCDYADSHKNKIWQKYVAAVATACAKGLLEKWSVTDGPSYQNSRSAARTADETFWTVRYPLNPKFEGRARSVEKIVAALKLSGGRAQEKQRRYVITGMRGMGKSELCIKVAETVRNDCWGVFWVDVSTKAGAKSDFIKLARLLGKKVNDIEDALLLLASKRQKWLLILDNADDPEVDYQVYLPSGNCGAVLMTSCVSDCVQRHTVGWEKLGALDHSNACNLLLNTVQLSNGSPHYEQACKVVKLLGSHTLALIQAGSYVARFNCGLDEYIKRYESQREELLRRDPAQAKSRYGNVYATFEASATMLEQSDSQSARDTLDLLRLWSMLPVYLCSEYFYSAWKRSRNVLRSATSELEDEYTLTAHHVSRLPGLLGTNLAQWSSSRLDEAVSVLESLYLVMKSGLLGSQLLSMPPLAHAWTQDRQSQVEQQQSWIDSGCFIAMILEPGLYPMAGIQTHFIRCINIKEAFTYGPRTTILPILLACGKICVLERKPSVLGPLVDGICSVMSFTPGWKLEQCLPLADLQMHRFSLMGNDVRGAELLDKVMKHGEKEPMSLDDHLVWRFHRIRNLMARENYTKVRNLIEDLQDSLKCTKPNDDPVLLTASLILSMLCESEDMAEEERASGRLKRHSQRMRRSQRMCIWEASGPMSKFTPWLPDRVWSSLFAASGYNYHKIGYTSPSLLLLLGQFTETSYHTSTI